MGPGPGPSGAPPGGPANAPAGAGAGAGGPPGAPPGPGGAPPAQQQQPQQPPIISPAIQHLDAIDEQVWLQLGSLAESMGEHDRALNAYESALRHNYHSVAALTLIAELHRTRENFPKVESSLLFLGVIKSIIAKVHAIMHTVINKNQLGS